MLHIAAVSGYIYKALSLSRVSLLSHNIDQFAIKMSKILVNASYTFTRRMPSQIGEILYAEEFDQHRFYCETLT